MGVAASSFRKTKGDELGGDVNVDPDTELWVTMKAKTTDKRTREVKKKKVQFMATMAGKTVGSTPTCDLHVDDGNVSGIHARVGLGDDGNAYIHTTGRTYFLIGQGVKNTGPHKLEKDQVVKMGACSLQVTDTCLHSRRPDDASPEPQLPEATGSEDPEACYICFDPSSETGRELMPSPCTCKKPVHRSCLSKWIATKGSRLCSICKGKLPIDFTVDPPFVVLQVVRHMRGLHWAGEREYIISFAGRAANHVTVGSGGDCDLSLPDPSLSRMHSRITHRDGGFYVEDMTSSAGTFLKLTGVHLLPDNSASIFKLGRTMLTIKVERRKAGAASASGLNVLRSWRARHRKLPLSPASAAVALAHGIVLEDDGTIRAADGVDDAELERRLAAALAVPAVGLASDGKLMEDGDEEGDGGLTADELGAQPVGEPVNVAGAGGAREEEDRVLEFVDDDEDDAAMTPTAARIMRQGMPATASTAALTRAVVSRAAGEAVDDDDDNDADFQAQLAAATAASLADASSGGGGGVSAASDSKLGDDDVEVD